MTEHHIDGKVVADIVAVGGALATFIGWLPAIAAILSIVWTLIRIWETRTVQGWMKCWRAWRARR